MRVKSFLLTLSWLVVISACEKEVPNNGNEKKFLVSRIYDSKTLEAELRYLNSIDTDKLSDIERLGVIVRSEELGKARLFLESSAHVVINMSRCLPTEPRIPPPGPCPIIEGIQAALPVDTHIALDLLGVFMDIPGITEFRTSQNQGSMTLTTTDGKEVFAYGTLNSYDQLFHTAWYHFDVKNPALANKPLILKIQTIIILQQQTQHVVMEIPIAAGTFLAD